MAKDGKIKHAKFSIKGFLPDTMNWFKLPKIRRAWIDQGNPNYDNSDPVRELVKKLHSGIIPVCIAETRQETPAARTYTLKPAGADRIPLFYAGQFLSAKFTADGRGMARPFTITSAPLPSYRENFVRITLLKGEGDPVSDHIWENWKTGEKFNIELPFGNMYYSSIRDAAHVAGIATGAGIGIFRSIAEDMLESRRPEKLTLLYQVKPADGGILFQDDLDKFAAASGGRIKIILIKDAITADFIKQEVPDYQDLSFYLSGGASFYEQVNTGLDALGIARRRRRQEYLGEGSQIEKHRDFPQGEAGKTWKLTLRYGLDQREIEANSADTLARTLEKAGLGIDTRCRSGECGWCRSRLIAGRIWQRPEGDWVRARDKDEGFIHPCSAYPLSDLALQVFTRLERKFMTTGADNGS
jgi:ferredoxin-NADP reductase